MSIFNKSEKNIALDPIIKLAEEGDAEALWEMGCRYLYGFKQFEKNIPKAIEYFLASSSKDFAQATHNLGAIFADEAGEFYPDSMPDYQNAFIYYKRAAEQGLPLSMSALGRCYLNGQGTVQSYLLAKDWLEKAARYSHISNLALFYLGKIYLEGLGVEKNLVEAHKYFNLASNENIGSKYQIEAIGLRETIENQMTVEQILEAQDLALKFEFLPFPEKFHLKLKNL